MDDAAQPTPKPAQPIRWRRWIGFSILGVLFVTLIAHSLWGRIAGRRLQARISELRAHGEWVTATDMAMAPVPDAENAALDFSIAADLLDQRSKSLKYAAFLKAGGWPNWPYDPAELEGMREILPLCDPALQRAAVGASKPRTQWPSKVKSIQATDFYPFLPKVDRLRELANAMKASALDAHLRADDAMCCDRLLQLHRLARAVDESPGGLVAHRVAGGFEAMEADAFQQIATELAIAPDVPKEVSALPAAPSGEMPHTAVSRSQMVSLIAQFLDDVPLREGFRRAMAGDRVFQLDAAKNVIDGKLPNMALLQDLRTSIQPFAIYALHPIIRSDALMLSDIIDISIAARDMPDCPSALKRLGYPQAVIQSKPILHLWARYFVFSTDRPLMTDYHVVTQRRATAIVLAIRLYTLDHDGRLPAKLDDLVPDYLPSIPLDPMASGGKPLRYLSRPHDPVIYSVGKNGVDDGGSEKPLKPTEYQTSVWEREDMVIHLRPQPKQADE